MLVIYIKSTIIYVTCTLTKITRNPFHKKGMMDTIIDNASKELRYCSFTLPLLLHIYVTRDELHLDY